MPIRPDCLDPIPASPYVPNSQSDQVWRMGYADGMDNDPMFVGAPAAYRAGWSAGRRHSVRFAAPTPAADADLY